MFFRISAHGGRNARKERRLREKPRFPPQVSPFLGVRGATQFCSAPDARTVSVLHPCPPARHKRSAQPVGFPILPWVNWFLPIESCARGIIFPPLSFSCARARDALRGFTATFSNTRSFGRGRRRVSFRPRPSQDFIGDLPAQCLTLMGNLSASAESCNRGKQQGL